MRILAIRGENLASLAGRFEIDLTAEPLAGVGLFAITGETGAGKSTILDALCLALYGEYPRVAEGRGEAAPDPSDLPMTARDPRAILRRGAASAFAEVDFVGQDGARYTARWAVHRARGRAKGRPQDEQRALAGLDDQSVAVAGKSEVKRAVERLTDLTFDQFRRTVLLAQGEFDAFLDADEGQRAELLEKITGTEIYARISRRIYEGTAERRRAVELLEHDRNAVPVLEDDARKGLVDELVEVAAGLAKVETERAACAAALAHALRLGGARASLEAAEERRAQAEAQMAALAPDSKRLRQLALLAPVRAQQELAAASRRALAGATAEAEQAQRRLAAAEAELGRARARVEAAQRAACEAKQIYSDYEPEWRLAERRDAEVGRAEAEVHAAEQAVRAAETAARQADGAFALLEREAEGRREELARLEDVLRASAAHRMISERRDEIERLLADHEAIAAREREAAAAAARAAAEIERLAAMLARAEGQIMERRRRQEEVARRIAEQSATLEAMDAPALGERRDAIARLAELASEAQYSARRHSEAAERADQCGRDARAAAAEQADASTAHAQAQTALRASEAARREIASLVTLADATVSREATLLRSTLAAGEPCPVCGGRDHPFALHDGEAGALAASVRRRRHELDADIAAADARAREAHTRAEGAAARRAAAERDRDRALDDAGAAAKRFAEALTMLGPCRRAAGLDAPLPEAPSAGAESMLAALVAATAAARAAVDGSIKSARELAAAIDRDRKEAAKLSAALDSAQVELRDDAASLAEARQARAVQAERALALGQSLTDTLRAIAPLLTAADMGEADLARDPGSARRRLRAVGEAYAATAGRRERLQRVIAEREPALAEARAAARSRADEMVSAGRALGVRMSARETARNERNRLLGGEATERHRQRCTDRLAEATGALEGARDDEREAISARAAAEARAMAVTDNLARARRQDDEAEAALRAAIAGSGLGVALIDALLAISETDRNAMATRVGEAERAASEARVVAAERAHDVRLIEREGAGADVAPLEELQARVASLGQAADAARERVATIKARIATDDEARRKVAGIAAATETATATLGVWTAVDAAVGSATGDRFRKFAQAVTLGELVRLANAQLRLINPRYRLTGGDGSLALHIVDLDMGEDVRAIRSLSGGERFLVSLALALGLSGLEGRQSFVDTLFIDEGFGSLDPETLDLAIDALEALQGQGRKVGVITHVGAMIERIAVQIRVEKRGQGLSRVRVGGPGTSA